MKTKRFVLGLGLILLALFILLDALGVLSPLESVVGEISIFGAILGVLLFSSVVYFIAKCRFEEAIFPLALLFILFERNIAAICGISNPDLVNNWIILLISLLLMLGIGCLRSSFKRHKKTKQRDNSGGAFGHSSVYIDANHFTYYDVDNYFGNCEIHFENPEVYTGGGILIIDNQFGHTVINVPSSWCAQVGIKNTLGAISEPAKSIPDGPCVIIRGDNQFGAIEINYV